MNHINDIKSEEHGAPEIWGVFVSLEVKLFPEQMSRTTNWCQSFFCSFFKTHQKNTNHDDTSSFFLTRRWTYGSFSSSCDDRNVFLSHGEFLWIIPPGILRPDWLRSVSTAQQHRPTDHWFWYYSHTFIRTHDELSTVLTYSTESFKKSWRRSKDHLLMCSLQEAGRDFCAYEKYLCTLNTEWWRAGVVVSFWTSWVLCQV